MTALALIGALWATAACVPVHCVHPENVVARAMAEDSMEATEGIEVEINKLADDIVGHGVALDGVDVDDMEAYDFRDLLEKFVYALNLRTIMATLRKTVSGKITPGHVIAKIKEVVGKTSSLAIGLVQVIKNMSVLGFKIFVNRLTGDGSSFYSAEDIVRDLPLFRFAGTLT